MHEFDASLRQLARQASSDLQHIRLATVSSPDLVNGAMKVLLQPEGTETVVLPYVTPLAGSGWGIVAIPPVGTQVVVAFEQGHPEAGIVLGSLYDNDHLPPTGYLGGEVWLNHKSGTLIKLTNDSKLVVVAVGDLNITAQANVNLTVTGKVTGSATEFDLTGDLNVTGNITSTKTITATTDVVTGTISLKNHLHTGVATGGGNSGPPKP